MGSGGPSSAHRIWKYNRSNNEPVPGVSHLNGTRTSFHIHHSGHASASNKIAVNGFMIGGTSLGKEGANSAAKQQMTKVLSQRDSLNEHQKGRHVLNLTQTSGGIIQSSEKFVEKGVFM